MLGSSFISSFGPRFQVLFSRCDVQRKAVAWIRGSTIRSLCVHAYGKKKYKKIIVSFTGTPSLTIILHSPHGLFNIQYFRSVHSLSTHNVCA